MGEARRAWAQAELGAAGRDGPESAHRAGQGARGEQEGDGAAVRATVAAQQHTPFHAPWAVAGPHGYQLSGVGRTWNEEGSAPPMASYSLRALWAQE